MGGATGSGDKLAQLQAPRLQSGGVGYAAWRDNMDVFLQRAGAEGIHRKVMSEAMWTSMTVRVEEWTAEAFDAAMALVTGTASASSSSVAAPLTTEVKEARKLVSATVERSRKVFGTLYSALPEELRAQVAHLAQGWSYGLWHWLETKFQSTEQDSVGELLAQWTTLHQDDEESFDAYRARVNKLAALLDQAKEKPSARMYAYMMLDRLTARYKQAVLALKVGEQLKDADKISWDTVTAFINAHERSEMRSEDAESAASAKAMAAASSAIKRPFKLNAGAKTWANAAGSAKTPAAPATAAEQRVGPRTLADVQCFNCQAYGHLSRQCTVPKKSPAGGKPASGANRSKPGNTADERSRSASSSAAGGFKAAGGRENQASAVLANNRFNTFSESEHEANSGDSSDTEVAHAVLESRSIPNVKKPKVKADFSWGVDTMASLHISGNKALFVKGLKRCDPVSIIMADGSTVVTNQRGSVELRVKTAGATGKVVHIPVDGVYYQENASNLVSWNMLKDKGWELHSTKDVTFVQAPGGNRVLLNCKGRVSMFDNASPNSPGGSVCISERVLGVDTVQSASVNDLVLLHARFGHLSFERMVKIIKYGSTLDVGKLNVTAQQMQQVRERLQQCRACAEGRGRRCNFGHRGLDRGQAPGEVLHFDSFVVRHTEVKPGQLTYEYGLAATEPFTKWRWFTQLRTKDEGPGAVVDIIRNAQTQLGCKVKRLYTDGGTEFVNHVVKSFCAKEGIELHYPPARTQQLNGVSESAVRWTKDAQRTLMADSGLPSRFCAAAATHATFLWNRTQLSSMTGVTPFESMYGRKPSAKHWGVFGCDVYYHVPKELRGATMAPKMDLGVYLGHDSVQNCAVVYSLRLKKRLKTRDVRFLETSFTHAAAIAAGDDHVRAILDRDPSLPPAKPAVSEQDEAMPQGGYALQDDNDAEESREYDVERITGQRKRKGQLQYKVQWTGYEEQTWEPADMMAEDAPAAVQKFLAEPAAARREAQESQPRPPPRQSPRLHAAATASAAPPASGQVADASPAVEVSDDAEPDLDELQQGSSSRAQVHMAMSAMRAMQAPGADDELQESHVLDEVASAVTAGVSLLDEQTPDSYRAAMSCPDSAKWKAAMDKEMEACKQLKVWELVDRADVPRGATVLPPKWVYKIKTDEFGALTVHKARVTPKGFRQKPGKDYFEVFARTGMYKTMRLGLSLTAKWDHELEQMDVPTAFLRADLEEDVYMELPEGYRQGNEHKVCRLLKSMYGLKQAPRNWYLLVSRFIKSLGFKATVSDQCLFFLRSRTGRLILLYLFVDDFQISFHREDRAEWGELKAKLVERFSTKDMGESKWILGMRIQRDRKLRTITLDQELYVTKALEKYDLSECKVADTPEAVGAAHQEPSEEQQQPADRQRFMEITGTVMYAAISTRPDIMHGAQYLASHMLAPTHLHMVAAERILRYLAGTKEVGLIFGSRNGDTVGDSRGRAGLQVDVTAYSDADWANSKVDRKSVTGWVAKLNGDPVSWASKKQRVVALSTCEAELYAKAAAIQEVLWLRGMLKELGLHTHTGSIVHGDNQSAIAVAKNGVKGERTKHVDVKYHFVTESVESGQVQLQWVSTHEQQADIFTKALAAPVFHLFRKQLMTR